MVIFNSYVKLPKGNSYSNLFIPRTAPQFIPYYYVNICPHAERINHNLGRVYDDPTRGKGTSVGQTLSQRRPELEAVITTAIRWVPA